MEKTYASLDHEELKKLAAEDARGQAEPEAAAFLREEANLQKWSDVLHEINKDLEAQFMERKADAQVVQNACFAKGPDGKREWFEYKAQHDQWRAGARRFHASIQAKIKENKNLMREQAIVQRGGNDRERFMQAIHRARDFISRDQNIAYSAIPERDELLAELEVVLWGERKEP